MEHKKVEPEQEFDRFLPCGPKKKDREASKQKLVDKINEMKNKKVEPEKKSFTEKMSELTTNPEYSEDESPDVPNSAHSYTEGSETVLCPKCRTTNFTQTCHDMFCPMRVEPEKTDVPKESRKLIESWNKYIDSFRNVKDEGFTRDDVLALMSIVYDSGEKELADLRAERDKLKEELNYYTDAYLKKAFTSELQRRWPSEDQQDKTIDHIAENALEAYAIRRYNRWLKSYLESNTKEG